MYPFREGSFAVRNGWYVAAFAGDLGSAPMARTIVGLPMALYRTADGTAVAVGGRCPHRNFPLGKGCVKGDAIVCGYHGIAFGPDGQCTEIPSQDFVPKSYRIPTYPLVEHGLWLWVWPAIRTRPTRLCCPIWRRSAIAAAAWSRAPCSVSRPIAATSCSTTICST